MSAELKKASRLGLLTMMRMDGATVFTNEVHGHVIGLVLPGENEVADEHDALVWADVVRLLEESTEMVREMIRETCDA